MDVGADDDHQIKEGVNVSVTWRGMTFRCESEAALEELCWLIKVWDVVMMGGEVTPIR